MIKQWLFGLLISGISGTVLTVGWLLFRTFLRFSPYTRVIYFLLRCVMLGYLIPFGYLLLRLAEQASGWSAGYVFLLSEDTQWIYKLVFAIWLVGFLFFLVRYRINYLLFRKRIKDKLPGTVRQYRILDEMRAKMKIDKEILIYQNYNVRTPFIMGIREPAIYIPVSDITDTELRMIYVHELTHYRQGDILCKPVLGIVCFFFWFYPPAIWGYGEMEKWAEHCCDRVCCEYYKSKDYFNMIQRVCKKGSREGVRFVSTWIKKESELMKRVRYIVTSSKKKKVKIGIMTAAALLFGMTAIGAGASTYAAMSLHDQVFYETVDKTLEADAEFVEDNLPEYIGTMDDFAGMTMENDEEDASDLSRTIKTIDWKLRKNVTRKTVGFKASKGGIIRVKLEIEPTNKPISIGIIQPDTSLRYIRATEQASHTFSLTQTGTYYVYVSNTNSVTVQVVGTYKR